MSRKDKKGRVLQKGESQRADGRYQFRTKVNNQTYWVYGNTLNEMRENKDKLIKQLESGLDLQKQKMTLNDLADQYLEMKEQTLQKSTFSTMVFTYDRYVRNTIGKRKLIDLRRSEIKAYYLKLMKDQNLSVSSISRVSEIITPVLDMAMYDDIISRNPASKVLGEIKRETHSKPKQVPVPTPDELKKVMKYLMDSPFIPDSVKNIIIVIYGTGLRVGEAIALTWDNIDFEQGTLTVRQSIAYVRDTDGHAYQILKQPKTDAGIRVVPMIRLVKEALMRELEYQQDTKLVQDGLDGVTNFCFVSNRRKPFTREAIWHQVQQMVQYYNESLDDEEKKIKNFSTHAIRHTFATTLCTSTSDLKAIQEIMGHSDISITMNIYAKSTKESKLDSMKNFEEKAEF